MSERDTSELISLVYDKVAKEGVWEVKIVKRRAGRDTEKQLALNRSKEFYDETEEENDARIEFTDAFGEFLIEVDDISEAHEPGSVEWHWEVGQLLHERDVVSELKHDSHQALGELIPGEDVDGDTLLGAKNIYELFPDRSLPNTDRVTMLRKLKYNADSVEDARNVLSNAQDAGFIPMNREIRVWKDVKPNPDLDEIVAQVNRRFPTYDDPGSKLKFIKHVYHLCRINEDSIPEEDKIETALEEQEG